MNLKELLQIITYLEKKFIIGTYLISVYPLSGTNWIIQLLDQKTTATNDVLLSQSSAV